MMWLVCRLRALAGLPHAGDTFGRYRGTVGERRARDDFDCFDDFEQYRNAAPRGRRWARGRVG